MSYPLILPAIVIDSSNNALRVTEGATTATASVATGTYYLRGSYATNLHTYSEEFDNGAWGKVDCSITANATTAPDGTLTADRFNCASTASLPYMYGSSSFTGTFTISIYAKRGTHSFFQFCSTATVAWWANFDVLNGRAYAGGTTSAVTITDVGHGWYRCTATITDASANQLVIAAVPSLTSPRADLSTLSTNFFLWGNQVEQGSFANEYVKTTTAAASGPSDDLCLAIKTALEAATVSANTYDVRLTRSIDATAVPSVLTLSRATGTDSFLVDFSSALTTFDEGLIGFRNVALTAATSHSSDISPRGQWVANDIIAEFEEEDEMQAFVERARSGVVIGGRRGGPYEVRRMALQFQTAQRTNAADAPKLFGAYDLGRTFAHCFTRLATGRPFELHLVGLDTGSSLVRPTSITRQVCAHGTGTTWHLDADSVEAFRPERLAPGVPLYSWRLRMLGNVP